jgi:hypothetical protein
MANKVTILTSIIVVHEFLESLCIQYLLSKSTRHFFSPNEKNHHIMKNIQSLPKIQNNFKNIRQNNARA